MADSEERYSLEEILAEFKEPTGIEKPKQTAVVPPAAKPARKPAPQQDAPLSEAEMRAQEAAFEAKMRERQKQQKKPVQESGTVDDTILATISQIKKENDAIPIAERKTDPGQITMKFPAVKEMAKKAEEGFKMPEEAKAEPLNFAAFTKREVPPPRKAPPKPTEEDKQRNRTSAPWRTAAEGGKTKPAEQEKAPPRLRTIDLTTGQAKIEFTPDLDAFDPDEPEKQS